MPLNDSEFLPVVKMQGFDRGQNSRRWMVPVRGHRYVQLRGGAGLTVTSSAPWAVSVTEIRQPTCAGPPELFPKGTRFFKLCGKLNDKARIQAKDSSGVAQVELEVEAKYEKTVRISFNFVKDIAGHQTTRVPASVNQWLSEIDKIYQAQANSQILSKEARWVFVNRDLGTVVRRSAGGGDEQRRVEVCRGRTADMNFFLVGEYESGFVTGVGLDQVDASTIGGMCLFEDNAVGHIEAMAHETVIGGLPQE